MLYVFVAVSVIFLGLYLFVELKKSPLEAIFYKAIASLSFVALGLYGVFSHQMNATVYGWMLLGLMMGLIGDLMLALRPLRPKEEDKSIINYGIIFFGMGHLSYIMQTIIIDQFYVQSALIGILMAAFIIIMSYLMKFAMGKSRIPSYLYALLIFTMIGQTIMILYVHGPNVSYLLLMLGAILFGVSDLILAPIYFQKMNKSWLIALNLLTYYAAQIFIALSLSFL